MEKIINLKSRYSDVHTKLLSTGNPNIYRVETNSQYTRLSPNEDIPFSYDFIDFDGGPFLSRGNSTLIKGKVIDKIYYGPEDESYYIEFIKDDLFSDTTKNTV